MNKKYVGYIGSALATCSIIISTSLFMDLKEARLYDGLLVEKAIIGNGNSYIIKIKDDSDKVSVVTISNDFKTFKFGGNNIYNELSVGKYYRLYTTGSDANIRFYE